MFKSQIVPFRIPEDVWFHTCQEYLTTTEIIGSIRYIDKEHFKYFTSLHKTEKPFTTKLIQLIKKLPIVYETFKSLIIESEAIVTVSFLLDAIHGESNYNDVDIIVPFKSCMPEISKYLSLNSSTLPLNSNDYKRQSMSEIILVRTYLINDVKFQIISSTNVFKTLNSFDFTVTLNYWDGKQLVINHIQDVCNKKLSLVPTFRATPWYCDARQVYRIAKYINKGFYLSKDNSISRDNLKRQVDVFNLGDNSVYVMDQEVLKVYNKFKTPEDEAEHVDIFMRGDILFSFLFLKNISDRFN